MAKKAEKKITGDVLEVGFTTGETLSINLADLPESIVHRLAMHGLSQKIGDSYAGGTVEKAFARASAVHKDLADANWSTRVAASGPRSTQLAEALALATGKEIAEAAEVLENMDDEQKKDLRKHPGIKHQLALIQQRNAELKAVKLAEEAASAPALEL